MEINLEMGNSHKEWELSSAFLLYKHRDEAFITVNRVRQIGEDMEIGPGKPISLQKIRSMVNKESESVFIDDKVLYSDQQKIIWWLPAQPARTIFFNTRDPELNGPVRCAHPALVFRLSLSPSDNPLAVCAIKGNMRPTPETSLFYAPYFNIWKSTVVCHGNADIPGKSPERADLENWENTFFNSAFSHPNHDGVVKQGALAFWKKRQHAKSRKFPESALVKTHFDLQKWADTAQER
ncbi:hypothetical protein B1757_13455 [Acidithiobacillus marinus]|uniref:PRTRC system protein B n=1 Tax=Acidithiobacillus marinus TaxID=187490 RepID=A0A2I1DIM7_9PROT|nr:PRTRC system protein B [Acidithiobacillus marinus]PKY09729.1 hypothetical protein B1757_13455 [Acidithiobacillus marinus]